MNLIEEKKDTLEEDVITEEVTLVEKKKPRVRSNKKDSSFSSSRKYSSSEKDSVTSTKDLFRSLGSDNLQIDKMIDDASSALNGLNKEINLIRRAGKKDSSIVSESKEKKGGKSSSGSSKEKEEQEIERGIIGNNERDKLIILSSIVVALLALSIYSLYSYSSSSSNKNEDKSTEDKEKDQQIKDEGSSKSQIKNEFVSRISSKIKNNLRIVKDGVKNGYQSLSDSLVKTIKDYPVAVFGTGATVTLSSSLLVFKGIKQYHFPSLPIKDNLLSRPLTSFANKGRINYAKDIVRKEIKTEDSTVIPFNTSINVVEKNSMIEDIAKRNINTKLESSQDFVKAFETYMVNRPVEGLKPGEDVILERKMEINLSSMDSSSFAFYAPKSSSISSSTGTPVTPVEIDMDNLSNTKIPGDLLILLKDISGEVKVREVNGKLSYTVVNYFIRLKKEYFVVVKNNHSFNTKVSGTVGSQRHLEIRISDEELKRLFEEKELVIKEIPVSANGECKVIDGDYVQLEIVPKVEPVATKYLVREKDSKKVDDSSGKSNVRGKVVNLYKDSTILDKDTFYGKLDSKIADCKKDSEDYKKSVEELSKKIISKIALASNKKKKFDLDWLMRCSTLEKTGFLGVLVKNKSWKNEEVVGVEIETGGKVFDPSTDQLEDFSIIKKVKDGVDDIDGIGIKFLRTILNNQKITKEVFLPVNESELVDIFCKSENYEDYKQFIKFSSIDNSQEILDEISNLKKKEAGILKEMKGSEEVIKDCVVNFARDLILDKKVTGVVAQKIADEKKNKTTGDTTTIKTADNGSIEDNKNESNKKISFWKFGDTFLTIFKIAHPQIDLNEFDRKNSILKTNNQSSLEAAIRKMLSKQKDLVTIEKVVKTSSDLLSDKEEKFQTYQAKAFTTTKK